MKTGNKPKIALVYDAIYPYIKGGGEKRFYELGKRLAKNGYEVHLYGMKFWDGPRTIKKDGLYLHGVCKARPLYKASGRRSIRQALAFGLGSLRLIFADFDYIDCCGFPYFSLFSCKLAALIKRKRLYATWHEVWGKNYWIEYLGPFGRVGYFVEWLATKLPDSFISVSQHTAENLSRTFKPKQPIHVVENGIDLKAIDSLPAAQKSSDLIYVGRLVAHKHIDTLIHTTARLIKTMPAVRLLIVGDGPEKSALEKLVKELGLRAHIEFTGFKEEYSEVISYMKASRLFVLPSTREGFGMVAIEANAAGIPVLTIKDKGNAVQNLVDGTNGSVAALDVDALARAAESWLAKIPTQAIYKQAVKKYDWEAVAGKLQAVLS